MVVPEFAGLSEGGREDIDDMEEQRVKNNMAVKRSRMKSRQKMSQMVDRWVPLDFMFRPRSRPGNLVEG